MIVTRPMNTSAGKYVMGCRVIACDVFLNAVAIVDLPQPNMYALRIPPIAPLPMPIAIATGSMSALSGAIISMIIPQPTVDIAPERPLVSSDVVNRSFRLRVDRYAETKPPAMKAMFTSKTNPSNIAVSVLSAVAFIVAFCAMLFMISWNAMNPIPMITNESIAPMIAGGMACFRFIVSL